MEWFLGVVSVGAPKFRLHFDQGWTALQLQAKYLKSPLPGFRPTWRNDCAKSDMTVSKVIFSDVFPEEPRNLIRVQSSAGKILVQLLPLVRHRHITSRQQKGARKTFKKEMARAGGCLSGQVDHDLEVYCFDLAQEDIVAEAVRTINARIRAMLDAPLSARSVERILKLQPTERLRWSKDGRLPIFKKLRSNRSNSGYQQPVYARNLILALEKSPEIIAAWRSFDRSAQET